VALSPGIPTSFVPRQSTPDQRRAQSGGHNLFLVISMFVFGLAILAAAGTYAYDRYLAHELQVKAEELAIAQRQVNEEQVEEFVRLRDRLTYGRDLLGNHIALSQVFDVLEAQTLASVRFTNLDLTVADDHTAQIEIEGTARNFNALAAQSNAFAAEKGIRRAIFSGIIVNPNKTVNFRLTADLDAKLVTSIGTDAPSADTLSVPAVAPTPLQTVPATTTPAATGTPALPSVPALTP
jgi:hypothetical protein